MKNNHFPLWVGDIVLYAQKHKVLVRDIDLFKAVVNGRVILLNKEKQKLFDQAKFSPESE